MNDRFRLFRDAAIAVAIVIAAHYFYANRELILVGAIAAFCAMVSRPIVTKFQVFRFSRWQPTPVRVALTLLFLVAYLLVILVVLLPSLVANLDPIILGYQARFLNVVVSVLNQFPPPQPLVTHAALIDATMIVIAVLFLAWHASDRKRLSRCPGSAFINSLIGRVTIVLAAGIGSFVAFGLIGLPHYDALAVFAGSASVVPVVGPLATSAVCGAAALSVTPNKLVAVLSYLIVYYEFENKILRPHESHIDFTLSTLAILASLMLGMIAGGLPGALIAVGPVMVGVLVLASMVQPNEPRELKMGACAQCDLAARSEIAPGAERGAADAEVCTPIVERKTSTEMAVRIAISGFVTLGVLEVLHVRYPWELAALTAAANLFPVIGSVAALFACAASAGVDSTSRLIGVLIFFLVYSQISPSLVTQLRCTSTDRSLFAVPMALFFGVVLATAAISILVTIVAVVVLVGLLAWSLTESPTATTWLHFGGAGPPRYDRVAQLSDKKSLTNATISRSTVRQRFAARQ